MNKETLIRNFNNRNIDVVCLKTKEELLAYLDTKINDGDKVGHGGSVTLGELGVYDYLNARDIEYLDRGKEGVDPNEVMHQILLSDVFLTSSSAITENGELFNIDGNGNRVAAMIYGPKKVIVVVGENKIVADLEAARTRVKSISAPANGKRLKTNTPCDLTGSCVDCRAPRRMCCSEVVINFQRSKRIELVIMEGNYGY